MLAALLFAGLFALAAPAHAAPPAFAAPGPLASDTGHIMIEWSADSPVTLELAQSSDFADARPLYQGSQTGYFLSGLAGGEYFLRLSDEAGARSEVVRLTVVHQSLARALWLTVIGAIITLGIIVVIVRGARND